MSYESLSAVVVLVIVLIVMVVWLPARTAKGMRKVAEHRADRYSSSLHLVDADSGTRFCDDRAPWAKGSIMADPTRKARYSREYVAHVRQLRHAATRRRRIIALSLLVATLAVVVAALAARFSPLYALIPGVALAVVLALGAHASRQARDWEHKVAEARRRQTLSRRSGRRGGGGAAGSPQGAVSGKDAAGRGIAAKDAVASRSGESQAFQPSAAQPSMRGRAADAEAETAEMEQREIRQVLRKARQERDHALALRQASQHTGSGTAVDGTAVGGAAGAARAAAERESAIGHGANAARPSESAKAAAARNTAAQSVVMNAPVMNAPAGRSSASSDTAPSGVAPTVVGSTAGRPQGVPESSTGEKGVTSGAGHRANLGAPVDDATNEVPIVAAGAVSSDAVVPGRGAAADEASGDAGSRMDVAARDRVGVPDLISFSLGPVSDGAAGAPESLEIKSTRQVAKAIPVPEEPDGAAVAPLIGEESSGAAHATISAKPSGTAARRPASRDDAVRGSARPASMTAVSDVAAFHEAETSGAVEPPSATGDSLGANLAAVLARRAA